MQNNSMISIFLLLPLATVVAANFQLVNVSVSKPVDFKSTVESAPLFARVVHDPDDGKQPPTS
jgi:hypothetical protein